MKGNKDKTHSKEQMTCIFSMAHYGVYASCNKFSLAISSKLFDSDRLAFMMINEAKAIIIRPIITIIRLSMWLKKMIEHAIRLT